MMSHRSAVLLCLMPVVLSSCAAAPVRGTGALSRLYDAPLAQVQEAARHGFQRLNLDIFEDSTHQHYLQGGKQSDVTDSGETVTVWLEEDGAGATRVWIDTRQPRWVWRGAFLDWSPKLLDHIRQEIQTPRE